MYIYVNTRTYARVHTPTVFLSFSLPRTYRYVCIYDKICIASERGIEKEIVRVREKQKGHTGRDLQIVHVERMD